ncbi:uncharacterized protein EV154DRAFT_503221 [Mucor mucedo]|uniref:uncharacterized protein n=1 Tax=Mucor mucedo TaxID=29922 RepID=UPI00221F9536|nr:uncharacterized protein EV154DRAFT_503221 [Mucor mucedo]KAI7893093.1 hypothetical protein EV154DRAFT_503221 [Mucor mucedo]
MFIQSPVVGLVSLLFLLLVTLSTQVEAKYSCCLRPTNYGYSSYCFNSKTKRVCEESGLTYYSGFAGFGNGCDVGDLQSLEARRKFSKFESGCGGRETYKTY